MEITYFKRYRMEINLRDRDLSRPPLPAGYELVAWDALLNDAFALAKYASFRDEIDSNVFPCLGELAGCRRLMDEIARKPGFIPGATWLLTYTAADATEPEYCGTIQGIRTRTGLGAVQNLGTAPSHRGHGLGTSLLFRSLEGFRQTGLSRVYLEVTAQNEGAMRLYERLGFVTVKTVFKTVEAACSQ